MAISSAIETLIRKYSSSRIIPYTVLYGQVKAESDGNASIIGDSGHSYGLLQINDKTAPSLGVTDMKRLLDPDYNLDIGTKYVKQVELTLAKYLPKNETERWKMIMTGYNSGPGYMLKALQRLQAAGNTNPTYKQAMDEMKKPDFGRTPIFKTTMDYADKIVGGAKTILISASRAVPENTGYVLIGLGAALLIYAFRNNIKKAIPELKPILEFKPSAA